MKKIVETLPAVILILGLTAAASLFSWSTLHMADFGYTLFYDYINVEEGATEVAAFHKDKEKATSFIKTGRPERLRLFEELSHGLNTSGDRLNKIQFEPSSGGSYRFINEVEMNKLLDMSKVLFIFKLVIYGMMVLGLFAVIIMATNKVRPPSILRALTLWAFFMAVWLVLWYLSVRPVAFPENLAWMFDARYSLLPGVLGTGNIITVVSIGWGVLSLIYFLVFYRLIKYIFKQNRGRN